jgi:hypothetical protein
LICQLYQTDGHKWNPHGEDTENTGSQLLLRTSLLRSIY